MGQKLLDILPEVPALMASYYLKRLLVFINLIDFVFSNCVLYFKTQLDNYKMYLKKLTLMFVEYFISCICFFTIMRGGYGTRPLCLLIFRR